MMPDLGRYWLEVTASYAASFVILGLLVMLVLWRSRKVRLRLDEMERRHARRAAIEEARQPRRETADA